jgi:cytochrome c oxidase subunit II
MRARRRAGLLLALGSPDACADEAPPQWRPAFTPFAELVAPSIRAFRSSLALLACLLVVVACDGPQSALDPRGPRARELAELWWIMAAGAVMIWLFVAGLAVCATRIRPREHPDFAGTAFIVGGGVAFPVVVLSSLLVYSFLLEREPVAIPGEGLRIEVTGHRWWWEVRYFPPGANEPVVSANEVRLPTGQPVELTLRSTDVIHSFWIPKLAGKTDMIPGRVNRMVIQAEAPGVSRGQCAEYCGGPHALMAFYAVAMAPDDFDPWLEHEARPARTVEEDLLAEGRELFVASGCGTCHTIRGTAADGQLGPDLTHVGGRVSLGAGILPNNVGSIAGWIADTQHLKPGNLMPSFNIFSGSELRALAAYLESLE